jgi:hypothetical protein
MDDFILLKKSYTKPEHVIGFLNIIKRHSMIDDICYGKLTLFKTRSPSIVKLCRICISDICKKLTELINWEANRFKTYKNFNINNIKLPENELQELKDGLDINIIDANFLYNQYSKLYKELTNSKILKLECIICKECK